MALAVTWEPLTPNYACIHSPLDSKGRSHMRPCLQLGHSLLPHASLSYAGNQLS